MASPPVRRACRPERIAVIGAGRLGAAAGRLLAAAGHRVVAVAARTGRSAEAAARYVGAGEPTTDAVRAAAAATIVFIATPDRAIRAVCERIAGGGALRPGSIVIHASGSQTRGLLDSARAAGALRAVIHPLQSIPSRERGTAVLPGSFCRVEADRGALRRVRGLVRGLGLRELDLPRWESDPDAAALYHAGAVAASNFLVTLLDFAAGHLRALGADRRRALRALLPLARGTLANVEAIGIPAALTGPIARGDAATVAAHVAALGRRAPALLDLYRALARRTIPLAREKGGLPARTAAALRRIVRE